MVPSCPRAEKLVLADNTGDLLADRIQRIALGHRFLDKHRNVIAAVVPRMAVAGGH